jgi:hypothetical protein
MFVHVQDECWMDEAGMKLWTNVSINIPFKVCVYQIHTQIHDEGSFKRTYIETSVSVDKTIMV